MININCIGAGRWGPNLIRCFQNLPGVRVRMVCDLDEARLELIRRRFGDVLTTTDAEETATDPHAEAVVVATPVRAHHAWASLALRTGKHTLVEKPLGQTVDQCQELNTIAQNQKLVLAVGHVFLFNPGIRRVRELIRDGHLGTLHYLHATRTNLGPIRSDVNALWDLASHDLSIFEYWLNAAPTQVTAHGERFLGQSVEDMVVATYRYPGGVVGTIHASWLNPRKVREITIVGDKAMAVWDDMNITEPVRVYDKGVERIHDYADSYGAFQTRVRDGDVVIPTVRGDEPLAEQCRHFIECIRKGAAPINNAVLATDVVAALEAADRSCAEEGALTRIGVSGDVLFERATGLKSIARAGTPILEPVLDAANKDSYLFLG